MQIYTSGALHLLTTCECGMFQTMSNIVNKKHLKNVGPIRHCEPPHAHSPGVATVATVACRLRIDVHDSADASNDDDNDNNDNA